MRELDGIVVLDLSSMLPGPYCTSLLCSMGAEVWKIERPGVGDFSRQTPESFAALSWGKRSVTLNLGHPEGKAIFLKMAEKADVIVEGFRPGVVARLGVDHEAIREINPRIVYCSISGYGQDGPYRDKSGHDADYQSLVGSFIPGDVLRAGVDIAAGSVPSLTVTDLSAGLFAALGITNALLGRQRTGQGSYVDISMTDGLFSWVAMCDLIRIPVSAPEMPLKTKRMDLVLPHYGAFKAHDGKYFTSGVTEDKFWKNLCTLIGREDWSDLSLTDRVHRKDEITAELAHIFAQKDRDEWLRLFEAADVSASPVNSFEEATKDPQLVHRRLFSWVAGADGSNLPVVRNPILPPNAEIETKGPPKLGEHNAEMLGKLGYTEEEIQRLRASKVI